MTAFTPLQLGDQIPGFVGAIATGSAQADAVPITSKLTIFTSVPSGSGCVLPSTGASHIAVQIINNGANSLSVYPAGIGQIDALGASQPYTIPASGTAEFHCQDPVIGAGTQWYSSATGGNVSSLNVTGNASIGGSLTLSGNPTTALQAATKGYADLMLPLAGGTMTGSLSQGDGTGNSVLTMNGAAGSTRVLQYKTAGSTTWQWTPQGTRSGSNAGDDLTLFAYNDAGSFLATAMKVTRANSNAQFFGTVTVPAFTLNQSSLSVGSTANQLLSQINSVSGSSATNQQYNLFTVNADTSTTPANTLARFNYTFGGAGFTGQAIGVNVVQTLAAASAPANTTTFYTALQSQQTAAYNCGGTALAGLGALYGLNIVPALNTGATFWREQVSAEIDSVVQAGASVEQRVNLKLGIGSTHATQGSKIDAILSFSRSRLATAGSLFGVQLGEINGCFPIDNTNGTIIGSQYGTQAVSGINPQAKYGVDLSRVNFGTAALNFAGFIVDGSGYSHPGSNTLSWSSSGLVIDAAGKVGGTPSVASGGANWVDGQVVSTGNGDLYTAHVTGGAITSLTVIVPATVRGSTTPSNPVTVLGDGGSGATVNITWTAASAVSINPTGGKVIMSGLPAADPHVAGQLWSNAGVLTVSAG